MGNFIVKPDEKKNLYILWSTNTGKPIFWGKKKHFLKFAGKKKYEELFGNDVVKRLERADERSSSSFVGPYSWEEDFSLSYGGYGYLYRSELRKFIKVYETVPGESDPHILRLVHKHED